MSTGGDATFNIIVGVQNRERIQQLEHDIESAEAAIRTMSATINAAGAATAQQADQLRMYGRDIGAYRDEIGALTQENIRLGEAAGGTSVRGITTMVRGLRQLSEGSEGLMMTLPRVAMMMGGSGELGLALGAAGLATVEFIKNWQDLKEIVGDVGAFQSAGSSLKAMGDAILSNVGGPSIEGIQQAYKDIQAQRKEKLEKAKEAESSSKKMEGLRTPEEHTQGALFTEALTRANPDLVKQEILGRMPKQKGEKLDEQKAMIDRMLGQGMTGRFPSDEKGSPEGFGTRMEEQFRIAQKKADDASELKGRTEEASERKTNEAQIASNKKLADEKYNKFLSEQDKAAKEDEKFNEKREEGLLQEQLTKLERQKRDQAEFHREHPDPTFGIHRGGQAIAESIQADLMKDIPKRQLKVQEAMQIGIDKVKDELIALRRGGTGATAQ